MEPAAAFAVNSPPLPLARRAPRGRHRRAATSIELRLCLVKAIARDIRDRALTAEDIRRMLGEAEASAIRREVGNLRAHRADRFGPERLQVYCKILDLDVFAVIAGHAARRLAA
ncbi:hypothetical protein [Methylorubrum sp. SL192]|uniref:hypothetical protein n=1 Tax=Methylorubrum sp. SL192 TaxID=2995167 RepID=UPI00227463A4|nr:hypothetical protein [Methylorubrum sp. SL192]MCY1644944.1 hypothetical protein [Methylorubrum sp. SL192]